MRNTKKGKKPPPYFYDGPSPSKEDKQELTEDIYDNETRETMLAEDDITVSEDGFMRGREQDPPSQRELRKKAAGHDDDISVELAKEDAEDS
jgi:hypothetical protein